MCEYCKHGWRPIYKVRINNLDMKLTNVSLTVNGCTVEYLYLFILPEAELPISIQGIPLSLHILPILLQKKEQENYSTMTITTTITNPNQNGNNEANDKIPTVLIRLGYPYLQHMKTPVYSR